MQANDLTFLQPLVAKILTTPFAHSSWTVQGFGFLRTYFGPKANPKRFRLNLWDSRFTIPNVSTIHDHPWDFKSIIVAGQFCNVRYDMEPVSCATGERSTHMFARIKCGITSTLEMETPKPCALTARKPELYKPGDTYAQTAEEIHETLFVDGSVTLNERIGDTEYPRVFWPVGTSWVDAKPRDATREEVHTAVTNALETWF